MKVALNFQIRKSYFLNLPRWPWSEYRWSWRAGARAALPGVRWGSTHLLLSRVERIEMGVSEYHLVTWPPDQRWTANATLWEPCLESHASLGVLTMKWWLLHHSYCVGFLVRTSHQCLIGAARVEWFRSSQGQPLYFPLSRVEFNYQRWGRIGRRGRRGSRSGLCLLWKREK